MNLMAALPQCLAALPPHDAFICFFPHIPSPSFLAQLTPLLLHLPLPRPSERRFMSIGPLGSCTIFILGHREEAEDQTRFTFQIGDCNV
ncbi:uncharacterized protein LY79DRAFT_571531 [Colletotrichum navitas]|uniref:Uncharacterized protein n=1 Tax=Colletotrichum navitas TaxID=681940 RepID=A0AAD8UZB7_9PEZI|nr:uncharacterized protein LY79DRAFT_571531 [Colletotrichum navitas]KAK1569644.1 hypothetical protein LY79DRAFT_571531 [Colletotrichum navitas]